MIDDRINRQMTNERDRRKGRKRRNNDEWLRICEESGKN